MAAFRAELILRYLRPHRRTVLLGVAALVVVNLLSVSIPLLVRRVIDDLQDGFNPADVRGEALLIVTLATVIGAVRLASRLPLFGVGGQGGAPRKPAAFRHLPRDGQGCGQCRLC